jgi:hypothetical protein
MLSVSCECYKSRLGCYICCNGYTRMLQASAPNVSAVSNRCCTHFIWVLHMFHTYVAMFYPDVLQWLHTCFSCVSDGCCKCFNYYGCMLQMFPLDVAKVDLVFAHVVVDTICSSRLLQLLSPPACTWVWRGRERQARETVQAQNETERRGTRNGHETRGGVGPHVKQACGVGVRTLGPVWTSGR